MLTLNSQIGKGGFGIVHSGTLAGKGPVAVKVVSLLKEDRGALRKILPNLFESVLLATFRHPHLSTTQQILTTETKLLIVQDLALTDLYQWRRSNVPTDAQLINWTTQIVSAMRLLHRYSILHGDIKPSNILLYAEETVRLADFTLARSLKDGIGSRLTPCIPNYRPLEVYLQRPFTLEIDLWSLGCTLFEVTYNYSLFPMQSSPGAYINNLIKWLKSDQISYRPIEYQIYILPENWGSREIDKIIFNLLQEEGRRRLPEGKIGKYSVLKPGVTREEILKEISSDPEERKKIEECLLSHLTLKQEEPCIHVEAELKICERLGFRLVEFIPVN